jgi:hypothetical protein
MGAFIMKKKSFTFTAFIILSFIGYMIYANHRFSPEETSFANIKKYEYGFINRNPDNVSMKHEHLITQANSFYQQYPNDKNKAIYYGIVYGLGESKFYNTTFLSNLDKNPYKDDFLEHFCLIQVHSANVSPTISSISPELNKIILNSDYKNNCF